MTNSINIASQEGEIYLQDERMILTSSSIFGTLRKDLIENIGFDRMKGFLIRYGWNLGVNDAKKSLKQKFSTVREILRQGPVLHMMQGYTKVNTLKLKLDMGDSEEVISVEVEGIWINSYEAEEQIVQSGISNESVCHTLIGYASGYYSTICGHQVIFKEMSCKGAGAKECRYVGKSLHLLDTDIQEELHYYHTQPIVEELAITYEKLLEERNNLSKVIDIHNRLTEELIKGRNLKSVVRMIYQITGIPLLIENSQNDQIFHAGFKTGKQIVARQQIANLHKQSTNDRIAQTAWIQQEGSEILITPIILQNEVYGYCAFFYLENGECRKNDSHIDQMILERVAMVCSIFLLNEKTSFESLERVKGLFLEQILNREFQSREEIIKKSRYLDCALDQFFSIVVIQYLHIKQQLENEYFIQQKVMEAVYYFFKKQHQTVLTAQRDGYIVLLIPHSKEDAVVTLPRLCHAFLDDLHAIFSGYQFKAGLSSVSNELENAIDVYQEAVTSLRMNKESRGVTVFEEVDLLGILMHTGNTPAVLQKAKKLLGPLLDQKDAKMHELLKTLYVFLQHGGNLEKITDEMSISMSGLRYRLKKIEELLRCEIREPLNSFQLYAAIKALLNAKEINI